MLRFSTSLLIAQDSIWIFGSATSVLQLLSKLSKKVFFDKYFFIIQKNF